MNNHPGAVGQGGGGGGVGQGSPKKKGQRNKLRATKKLATYTSHTEAIKTIYLAVENRSMM
jgi:hypothetical protein